MSYQKSIAGRGLNLAVKSDTIPIPTPGTALTGTATATTANKLVNSTGAFIVNGVKPGMIIWNTTDATAATVTSVDSATTLSISADIMTNADAYQIYNEYSEPGVFYVGTAGNVVAITAGGDTVTIAALSGSYHPIQISHVKAATTATGIIIYW